MLETQYAVLIIGDTPREVLALRLIPSASITIPSKYKIKRVINF
jgi:hypothetical protein